MAARADRPADKMPGKAGASPPSPRVEAFAITAQALDTANAAYARALEWAARSEADTLVFIELKIVSANWPDGSLYLQGAMNELLTDAIKAGMVNQALERLKARADKLKAEMLNQLNGDQVPAQEGVEP